MGGGKYRTSTGAPEPEMAFYILIAQKNAYFLFLLYIIDLKIVPRDIARGNVA